MTMQQKDDHRISTREALEALYDKPYGPSIVKEIDHVNADYRKFIEASPFCALATAGPGGLDCSPRGDAPGFVRVKDEKTLLIPEPPRQQPHRFAPQHRRRARSSWWRSSASFSSAAKRLCARNCGTRGCMSSAIACRAGERSLPASAAARSADRSTTAVSR